MVCTVNISGTSVSRPRPALRPVYRLGPHAFPLRPAQSKLSAALPHFVLTVSQPLLRILRGFMTQLRDIPSHQMRACPSERD